MIPDVIELAIVAVVFFVAGTVKGVIGLGLPTIAMGLLGALMRPPMRRPFSSSRRS